MSEPDALAIALWGGVVSDLAALREADIRRMADETLMDGSLPFKPGADYDSFAAGLGVGVGAFRDRLLAALASEAEGQRDTDPDVEKLADLFMDLRLDGPTAEGWTYQQTARHYARIILGRWLAGIRQDAADPLALHATERSGMKGWPRDE